MVERGVRERHFISRATFPFQPLAFKSFKHRFKMDWAGKLKKAVRMKFKSNSPPIPLEFPLPPPAVLLSFLLLFPLAFFIACSARLLRIIKTCRTTNFSHKDRLLKHLGRAHNPNVILLGFFHPYCNAGGGGERVLFEAIAHHQRDNPNVVCVVYTGDVGPRQSLRRDARSDSRVGTEEGQVFITKEDILERCKSRFGLNLEPSSVHFLPLRSRELVSDSYWKRLTLLGQSYGSIVLAFEAMKEVIPDIFIDTMGYAFTYPTVRLFSPNVSIGSYTHYPTISTDMLRRVRNRETGHTNNANVSSSRLKSNMKLWYYQLFSRLYSFSLRQADNMVVNGSWTQAHINSFLSSSSQASIVYPPCDTKSLCSLPLETRLSSSVVSLAQFRPEKEQTLQVKMLKALFDLDGDYRSGSGGKKKVILTLMGSCRNQGDEDRIAGLKNLSRELGIEDNVRFLVNAPWSEIVQKLSESSVGLSTMVDEHFGMNVVEFMAAGVITLSHASAGPLLDIAILVDGEPTGFHALTLEEFAIRLRQILSLSSEEALSIRKRARRRAQEVFSSEEFARRWGEEMWEGLESKLRRRREGRRR